MHAPCAFDDILASNYVNVNVHADVGHGLCMHGWHHASLLLPAQCSVSTAARTTGTSILHSSAH